MRNMRREREQTLLMAVTRRNASISTTYSSLSTNLTETWGVGYILYAVLNTEFRKISVKWVTKVLYTWTNEWTCGNFQGHCLVFWEGCKSSLNRLLTKDKNWKLIYDSDSKQSKEDIFSVLSFEEIPNITICSQYDGINLFRQKNEKYLLIFWRMEPLYLQLIRIWIDLWPLGIDKMKQALSTTHE